MRQGQVAADNMLGYENRFDSVPFFWTEQYGLELRASGWLGQRGECRIEGSIASSDLLARYNSQGNTVGVVTLGRDLENLEFERNSEKVRDCTTVERDDRPMSSP